MSPKQLKFQFRRKVHSRRRMLTLLTRAAIFGPPPPSHKSQWDPKLLQHVSTHLFLSAGRKAEVKVIRAIRKVNQFWKKNLHVIFYGWHRCYSFTIIFCLDILFQRPPAIDPKNLLAILMKLNNKSTIFFLRLLMSQLEILMQCSLTKQCEHKKETYFLFCLLLRVFSNITFFVRGAKSNRWRVL